MSSVITLEQFSTTGTGRLIAFLFAHLSAAQGRRAERCSDARVEATAARDHRVRADLQAARDRNEVDAPVVAAPAPMVTPDALPRRPLNEGRGAWLRRYPLAYA